MIGQAFRTDIGQSISWDKIPPTRLSEPARRRDIKPYGLAQNRLSMKYLLVRPEPKPRGSTQLSISEIDQYDVVRGEIKLPPSSANSAVLGEQSGS